MRREMRVLLIGVFVVVVGVAFASPLHDGRRVLDLTPTPEFIRLAQVPTIPATPSPTRTLQPTATNSVFPTSTSTTAAVKTINGMPLDEVVVLDAATRRNIQRIYRHGQALGNDSGAFSKIGDCNSVAPYFLANFDDPDDYDLGEWGHLQAVIPQFDGSFARESTAVRIGFHTWSVQDPMWAGAPCEADENAIECEFRLHRPSIVLIRIGTNDVGMPDRFEANMRQIIKTSITAGVIPVLGTKADRFEGEDNTNNEILRQLAADYRLPLWDFDHIAQTLPANGLRDNVHLSYAPPDYSQSQAFEAGHSVQNLTALLALDAVWQAVEAP
jgi:hypothetical protein